MTVQNLAAIAAMTQPSLSNAAAAAAAATSPGSAQLTNTAALLCELLLHILKQLFKQPR